MAKVLLHRTAAWLAAASASALLAPASAQAQTTNWAKTEAILGGAPSALEAILAKQQGHSAPVRRVIQPASLSIPAVAPAVLRASPAVIPVRTDRPDVFGSVALRVGQTRLDARWNRVEKAGVGGPAARFAESLKGRDKLERLEAVNWYVNRRVRFVDDQREHGRPDVWSAAGDTLSRGRGDCEDFAIAKLQILRRAGIAERDLYLVIVKDLVSRSDHAVLVARADNRMLVLDNGTDQLLDSSAIRDYRPILSFASSGTWTHGYRVQSDPMIMASAGDSVPAPVAPAAGVQRSRSASLLAFNTGLSR
jgi:predicted transglutaminase-like cysteine proteinase